LVSFRFYEGIKGNETSKTSVVTSYHLRPLFVGNLVSETGLAQEKKELKRIFNLTGLKLMNKTGWVWKANDKERGLKVIILNGHEFRVGIGLKKKRDTFNVVVSEKGKSGSKKLLDTEIVLPQEKTTVFGFEDSMKKSYFLSFHREKDVAAMRRVSSTAGAKPILIKRVSPAYPKVAAKAGIWGDVIMEAQTDINGNVESLKVLKGHPLLRFAAIKAVRQWKYEPLMVKGKPQPATFTVMVTFSLDQLERKKPGTIKRFVGSPINVKLKDASLKSVLVFFQKVAGVTITVDPGIKGWVTCDFTEVPWDLALERILRLNSLEMVREGKKLRIRNARPTARKEKPAAGAPGEKKFTGEPMDFEFKNARLSNIIQLLAKVSGTRINLQSGIDGQISCLMKKVPWDEALDLMLKVNDLYMTRDKDHIEIRKVVRSKDTKSAAVPDIWPAMGYLTDGFGDRVHPLTGKPNFHRGIDIASREGNHVIAAGAGVVVLSEFRKSDGNLVVIDHQNGYTTRYAKLRSFKVKKGEKVKKGDLIGYVGNTGVSTSPHLHWEVWFNGKPIDPMTVVKD
ncbi:MAG: TonB family protein, partial [bacterium]|nr:TonB family protein [bacterium]